MLSRALMIRGHKVLVFDHHQPSGASLAASGLINPVSGMRLVKVNRFETYLSVLKAAYGAMEVELGIRLLRENHILSFHETAAIRNIFLEKQHKQPEYTRTIVEDTEWHEKFRFEYGVGEIAPCWLLDMEGLLSGWRQYLLNKEMLINEIFDWNDCRLLPEGVNYRGITARKVICCDGVASRGNPYFNHLPFTDNKGEVLLATIPGLDRRHIYRYDAIAILPWKDDLFWVGASFDRKYEDAEPSLTFRESTEAKLNKWLKLPYTITQHLAALRPTTVDRMPFVGIHPDFPAIGIFNGMGTKGCMYAPYYSAVFAQHLDIGDALPLEVDVRRFLSK